MTSHTGKVARPMNFKRIAGSSAAMATAVALIVLVPTTASAVPVHAKKARPTSGSPGNSGHCGSVLGGGKDAGFACFKKKGDRFWVKDNANDGHHVELRGAVNTSGDGFRCIGSGRGWQICDFSSEMPEGASFAWYTVLCDGNKVVRTGSEKFSYT